MVCPKCKSQNVDMHVVNEVKIKNKHHGVVYWLFIGWWLRPILWLFFALPMLILKLFGHKKQKAVNIQKTVCICKDCGNRWDA